MSEKIVLYYFDGRGKMESIRWLLAAAGVQFEEVLLTKREQYVKLLNGRTKIDMYTEGLNDLMEMRMILPFKKPDEKQAHIGVIQGKATSRYFPVYEKALNNSQYLVGNQFSRADVHLMEATLMLEELFPTILSTFPNLKAFQGKMRSLPTISKFLQPGSQRKPQPDDVYVKTVMEVLNIQIP
ncbi:glutathione S-transferase, alpha tandem duplicate 1 isoform X3 [Alosa alosa]|uniref:glutathione S-transferase, alpha tandem duplicate 1 isoform X3 n=1 Tax=Alosa alosa TaxID=278164 RepID=UPI00201552C8|nr:glutathione S-transferase, alpha tandem duplicate 1 isoform X3 [Alosa alosa]